LASATEWEPVDGTAVEGMVVYNDASTEEEGLSGKGIYVWYSGSWNKLGASAKPCKEVEASATQNGSYTGDISGGKTLEVSLSAGTAPYTYRWFKNGSFLVETQNTSNYQDSYYATDYGSYVCKISNGCTDVPKEVTFNIANVNSGDYTDTPAGISWNMSGITCFDVRSSLVTSSDYTLSVTGATISSVIWDIQDPKSILSGSTATTNSKATLPFKPQATVTALALPATVTVTAYIILSTGAKVSVAKAIKFQNQSCCDGAIIYDAAYDYTSLPGDGAIGKTVDATTDQTWSPNITATGSFSATALDSYFKKANKDLCVYKTNANGGSYTTWVNAVNNCGNGSYADGDVNAGWYLPNERELLSIYLALGGSGGSAVNFSNLQAVNGVVATTAENMVSSFYWSSTEYSSTNAIYLDFANGHRGYDSKKYSFGYRVRCVRRI
jgi:hypothetical protein